MATETASGLSDHMRGVTVTTLAALAGLAAGVATAYLFGTGMDAAQSRQGLAVVATALLVQLPLLKLVGLDVEEFGTKDFLYIGFMTFALWFITYAILLSTGVTL